MVWFIYCRVLDNGQWGRTWIRRKIECQLIEELAQILTRPGFQSGFIASPLGAILLTWCGEPRNVERVVAGNLKSKTCFKEHISGTI